MQRTLHRMPNGMPSLTDQMDVTAFSATGKGHGWMGKAVVR